jgi:tetratricopeptide (TPR) repeat protein/transcriptional regulator with XRE-family HTH domain
MADEDGDRHGTFRELLRRYRANAGLSQEALAARSGISADAISMLERGIRSQPRDSTVLRLVQALRLRPPETEILISAARGLQGPGTSGEPRGTGPTTTIPRELPRAPAYFTGRADELAGLKELLGRCDRPGVIGAVDGMAGIGKSALAIYAAHQLVDSGLFTDGQLYVNLRAATAGLEPLEPLDALGHMLRSLSPEPAIPADVEEAAALFRSLTAGRRLLVLLDDARDAEQVRPLLPGSATCGVLITSRDRLTGLIASDGAQCFTLDVLASADSVDLIQRIIGVWAQADVGALVELARLCAYLPLALRIAAADLTSRPRQVISRYVAELAHGDRLARLQVRADPKASVRSAFEVSYTALMPDEQRMLRLLGLVPGPDFTQDAAAVLSDVPLQRAGEVLHRLATLHLIDEHWPRRFRFHDLLRLYAQGLGQAFDGEHECSHATRRLFDWYLRSADAAASKLYPALTRLPMPSDQTRLTPISFDGELAAREWLDAERPNLVAAIRHAAANGSHRFAWLLADTLRGYFVLRRFMTEWFTVAGAGLAAADAERDLQAQAAAHLSLAQAHQDIGRYPEAISHYDAASGLARQVGWGVGEGTALSNLGNTLTEMGQLGQARVHFDEALTVYRRIGYWYGQARALNNLGSVYNDLGQLEQAAACFTRALVISRQTGSLRTQGYALNNLGGIHRAYGEFDLALDCLTQALVLFRELGDRVGEVGALNDLSGLHSDAERPTEARRHADAALMVALNIGDRRLQAEALSTLGAMHLSLGQADLAIGHLERALQMARKVGARRPEVRALIGLAVGHRHLGHTENAYDHAQQALTIARELGYGKHQAQALELLDDIDRSGGGQGRPTASHATGHAGPASGGSSGKPSAAAPSVAEGNQALRFPTGDR